MTLQNNFKNFPFFNFTCKNLYELNKDDIFQLINYSSFNNITDLENNLLKICKLSRLAENNEISDVFQRHYQDIHNSIITIHNFSFEGLINHLKEGKFGNIIVNFNCILIYLLDIISSRMHKIEIDNLIILLKRNLMITLIITFLFYFILIILTRLFYIRRHKIYCNQVLLLKKVFKIYEIQEQ